MELLSSLVETDIARAASCLAQGGLVAFPTETVYGLGGDAFNVSALARIFEVKNRPRFDPLIIHIAEMAALDRLVRWESLEKKAKEKLDVLIRHFWPGPLTLVLPKRPEIPDLATSGLPTAAIRFPAHEAAQKLIKLSTGAVAAPSANPFGCLSPTRAEHVAAQLGNKVDFILDGGRTGIGLESTVLDISTEPCRILRPGGLSQERIEALIGPVLNPAAPEAGMPVESPGRLKSHYAPHTPLSLCPHGELASLPDKSDEGRLYFSLSASTDLNPRTRVLSLKGDLVEAAANFFDMLHELDKLGLRLIRAEEAPAQGLGAAINDRLRRATVLAP
jgi:L-threonylcarbamoyladenylate synthase